MKLGIVSDIHGNSFALKLVLDELRVEACDSIVCLGDIAVLGPDPTGSIALVREYAPATTVLGNVDRWLVNRLDDAELHESATPELRELAAWSLDQIDPDDLVWMEALQLTGRFNVPGPASLLAFHGSPRSNDDVISTTTATDDFKELRSGEDVQFAIGGHTHIQMVRRFGSTIMINPGSVGLPGIGPGTLDLPVNRDVAWAEYAVVTIDDSGHSFDLRRTNVDLPGMLEWARSTGMPAFDWWRSKWRSN